MVIGELAASAVVMWFLASLARRERQARKALVSALRIESHGQGHGGMHDADF